MVIRMSVIKNIVANEEKVFLRLKNQYEKELKTLPKGTLTIKNKVYYYLNYVENGEMISKYIGKQSDFVDELKRQIAKRQHIEKLIRNLNYELKIAQRVRNMK